jgi:hypothetical protein
MINTLQVVGKYERRNKGRIDEKQRPINAKKKDNPAGPF